MSLFFFVSDLHGSITRYKKLFNLIESEKPEAVFLGGDLLPSGLFALTSNNTATGNFIHDILFDGFSNLKKTLGSKYPRVLLILGNDDGKGEEDLIIKGEEYKYWEYIHNKKVSLGSYDIYGYSYVPPSPFMLKDWELYDVSRYTDPGCVAPEDGAHFGKVDRKRLIYRTIQKDLSKLVEGTDLDNTIILFHTPPYKTNLDRAALDGKMIDYVPLDVNVGSIAVKRLIEERSPKITLHGHIHESASITGHWKEKIGKTIAMSAAHDGSELALVRFDPDNLQNCSRELV